MMNTSRLIALGGCLLLAASCQQGTEHTEQQTAQTTATPSPTAGTGVLADAPKSTDFPNAQLSLAHLASAKVGADSAKVTFDFSVQNYQLKNQTADTMSHICNNSKQGQHIHFILDNKPYIALYEPKHEVTLPLNSEHYLLCFLSRSYHESIKHKGAATLLHFKVDDKGGIQQLAEPTTPMLFYSRPKGDYLGADTANLLLDYYLWNNNGHWVKAEFSNTTTGAANTFELRDWKPYLVQRLGTGDFRVKLTLVDKDGNPVTGPNTSVTRENVRLIAQEPTP